MTGAASGIGRGIAVALAHEGACVVLSDLPGRGGEDTVAELRAKHLDASFIAADLSKVDVPERLLRDTIALAGCPSVLVHAASPRRLERDHVAAVELATWDEMLTVNSAVRLRARARGGARDERAGRQGSDAVRDLAACSCTAQPPALQRGEGWPDHAGEGTGARIRSARHSGQCNRAGRGAGWRLRCRRRRVDRLVRCTSLRRLGTPEEIAGLAVALLADRFSAYVTGATVVVDGGVALHNWSEPVDS